MRSAWKVGGIEIQTQLALVEVVKAESRVFSAEDFRDPGIEEGSKEVVDVGNNRSKRFLWLLEVMDEIHCESFRFGMVAGGELGYNRRPGLGGLNEHGNAWNGDGGLGERRASRQC